MIPGLLMFCNIEPYAAYYVCITNILFDHLKQYHWFTTCVFFVKCRYSIQVGYDIACIIKFKNKSEKRRGGYINIPKTNYLERNKEMTFFKESRTKIRDCSITYLHKAIKKPTIFNITLTQISLVPTLIVGNFQLLYR